MKTNTLWQLSITTSPEAEDAMSELLGRLTGKSVAVYSNAETRISEVSTYFDQRKKWNKAKANELNRGIEVLRHSGLEAGSAKIELRPIRREDWAESWKRHFKPIAIGTQLLVKPSWIKQKPLKNQAVVVLDPGLSFGTGNHPTTSFCLHEVVSSRVAGTSQRMLDIGCGSGILAIAAVKLGYATVKAFDFDPEAVRVARENAAVNKVSDKLRPTKNDITKINRKPTRGYDLVCANLISNLLIQEKERIRSQVGEGGKLVLAGILAREFLEVRKAFESMGFRLLQSRIEGEWESGSFLRGKK